MDNVVFYLKEISANLKNIYIGLFGIVIVLLLIAILKDMGGKK
jgi:hypothetical protein